MRSESAAKLIHSNGLEQGRGSEMRLEPDGRDGEGTACLRRRVLFLACLSLCGSVGRAVASELVIGREALQTLVVMSVFKDQGRWNLVTGKCYAYLERPQVALEAGRVIIDAHLSSRLGLTVGGSCVGTELASDVRVSGKLVGSGSHIEIDDIRIDRVQDGSTRNVVELLQSATGGSVPKSANIDLLPLLKPASVPGTDIKVSATSLSIANVSTLADAVDVDFEIKLTAR
jgi:hypothetical protein